MEKENWITELAKEKGSVLLLVPILVEAIINLERRVDKLEMAEKIRKGEL